MKNKDVLNILQITQPTLRKLKDEKIIKVKIINEEKNRFDYDKKSVYEYKFKTERKDVIYYCDSSINEVIKKISEIEKELSKRKIKFDDIYYDVTDKNSFIKDERKKCFKLIEEISEGKIDKVIIVNKKNFLLNETFFDMIKKMSKPFGVDFIIINEKG